MKLEEIVKGIAGFSTWKHADKIKFFAWFLHSQRGRDRFSPSDIRACYDGLSLERPSDVNPFLTAMLNRKPKEVLKDMRGYALETRIREPLEARHGQRAATIQVDKLLSELPTKIPNLAERDFLREALICFRHKALRAAIVMTWNLAYDHLCEYVLTKKLAEFNAQLPRSFPRADISVITNKEDFSELKESQVMQVCRSANITSKDVHKVLKEKLDRRNTYAHPSTITLAPQTAEEYIIDLVNNVVLMLK
jgi:hypothetical protein